VLREVLPPQRPPGDGERFRAPEFMPQQSQGRAIEEASFRKPRAHDHIDRERAPRLAVQFDGNAAAPAGAQPGDGWHYFREAAFSIAAFASPVT
jgi:hypothetical protein